MKESIVTGHTQEFISLSSHLACSSCGKTYPMEVLQTYAACCTKPFLVGYDLHHPPAREALKDRPANLWRYGEMLPLKNGQNRVSLGEGMTPVLELKRLGERYDLPQLFLKDEGLNPTGSFKARGLSMAVSKALELGVKACVIATAGNAGGALAAYCATAGIKATVVMPVFTPRIFQEECRFYGAVVETMDGLIDRCGQRAAAIAESTGAFNFSTLKEPYRLEGKKTLGYEIAEQMGWNLPDVILYPTGGGTGLIGMWKAFHEMKSIGWLSKDAVLPKMIAVQSSACAPVVDAFYGRPGVSYGPTVANGLAVPVAFGMDLILQVIRDSGGTAVSVPEASISAAYRELGAQEGLAASPEGGTIWVALKDMVKKGEIDRHARILLINTGSVYKYLEGQD